MSDYQNELIYRGLIKSITDLLGEDDTVTETSGKTIIVTRPYRKTLLFDIEVYPNDVYLYLCEISDGELETLHSGDLVDISGFLSQ